MLIADLVTTSTAVAATRSRKAKVAALADDPRPRLTPTSSPVVTSYLGGALLQRRTGLGWRGLADAARPRHVGRR